MEMFVQSGFSLLVGLIFLAPLSLTASAQEHPSKETIRAQMLALLRYVELEQKATPEEIDKLVELWMKARQTGLSSAERQTAFRDLYLEYYKLSGIDLSSNPQRMTGLAQRAAASFDSGARLDLRLPEPRGKIIGNYLDVDSQGRGPIPMLLISDGGVDGKELYRSFIERNKTRYTMQVVTLPAAGKAKPLPWPEVNDITRRPWLNYIEQALVNLLEKQKAKMVIVGTAMGGYFAARLAVVKPERIRAVVLVDAQVNVPMRSRLTPDTPASIQERLSIMKTVVPTPQFFPLGVVPAQEEIRKILDASGNTHPAVQNWMRFAVKDEVLSKRWTFQALSGGFFEPGARYGFELQTTDLTADLQNLTVPLLAMCALPDEGSPRAAFVGITQWEETKLLYPTIPLTIAAFADTRSYISEDSPAEFDQTLSDFLAGKSVVGKTSHPAYPRPSPRALTKQTIGTTQVTINYGRPNLQGRELVELPKGRVWRAGADEATTITFSADVNIDGQKLAAGTYSLFTIPDEKNWTVIFNKVPTQWGAFNYNSTFDALRVKVQTQPAEPETWLTFSLELINPKSANLVLHWGKLKWLLKLESLA